MLLCVFFDETIVNTRPFHFSATQDRTMPTSTSAGKPQKCAFWGGGFAAVVMAFAFVHRHERSVCCVRARQQAPPHENCLQNVQPDLGRGAHIVRGVAAVLCVFCVCVISSCTLMFTQHSCSPLLLLHHDHNYSWLLHTRHCALPPSPHWSAVECMMCLMSCA